MSGKVILYADKITDSMQRMIDTTSERREKQMAFNTAHGISPVSAIRAIDDGLRTSYDQDEITQRVVAEGGEDYDAHQAIQTIEEEMLEAAEALEFERAAVLRDRWQALKASQSIQASKTKGGAKRRKTKHR
jgi:excinuclease ABC subunit B